MPIQGGWSGSGAAVARRLMDHRERLAEEVLCFGRCLDFASPPSSSLDSSASSRRCPAALKGVDFIAGLRFAALGGADRTAGLGLAALGGADQTAGLGLAAAEGADCNAGLRSAARVEDEVTVLDANTQASPKPAAEDAAPVVAGLVGIASTEGRARPFQIRFIGRCSSDGKTAAAASGRRGGGSACCWIAGPTSTAISSTMT